MPNTPATARTASQPSEPHEAAWAAIRSELQSEFGERTFTSWLKPIRLLRVEHGEAVLALETKFTCDYVRDNFAGRLRSLWAVRGEGVRHVRLVVAPAGLAPGDPIPFPGAVALADTGATLEPRFRFDSFILGTSNEIAWGAARKLAEGALPGLNLLFLHSCTGLGKTHLMQAIGHDVRARNLNARIAYLSAEKFMVEFRSALRSDDMDGFKQRMRGLDLLMIDDVQFIAGKEKTQDEFFHTLNELMTAGRRIVISADRPPRDLLNIQDRILSRLAGGLVADIGPADYELRLNILHAKLADIGGPAVPDDVMKFLARRISSNVRELEGALNRVVVCAEMRGTPITIDFASIVLADQLRAHDRRLTVDEIIRRTADQFGLKVSDLLSPSRARDIARPRQVAMYVAKKMTQRSLPEIGRRFGGKDHTTVLHAVRRIEELRATDRELDGSVAKLMRSLEN
ncbi:MAG: chromosomal replication initiator protein DnaA [Sphingomonadaceae bacterium]|nr:chromosomal replication initiator protein DnaA [Sphingomonadaceae bacterium]